MGAAPDRIFTTEESLAAISKKSAESGDEFYLKVFRRLHMASTPSLLASFSGAQVQHFSSPELWLPALAGGGKFLLQAFHGSDVSRPVGSFMGFSVDSDEVRDIDVSATKKADWRGPAKLEYPAKEAAAAAARPGDMPLYDVRAPPAPGSSESATRTHVWPRQAGGGLNREDYEAFGPQAKALEAERRQMERDKIELERDKHRAELEAMKKGHEADMQRMKSEVLTEVRSSKPSGPDPTQTMMMEFFKHQASTAAVALQQAAEDRRAAEQRALEERRLERDRQDKADARLERFLEKISERKERDPLELVKQVTELVGKRGNDSDAMMKSVHNMVEMQSSMMGAAMDFVDHASRLQLGGGDSGDPGWVKGIDRLLKGIGGIAKGAAMRGGAPVFPAAQQQVQVPQQVRAAMPAGMQPAPAVATREQVAARAPGSYVTQPQPPAPPAGAVPAPQQVQPAQSETELSVVDQIIQAIQAHWDAADVASKLLEHYSDPSVQQAVAQAGGDFELAFKQRLGNWEEAAPQNKEYLKTLFAALEKELQKRGLVADEPDEDDGSSDDDDDDDGAEDSSTDEGDDE